MERHMPEMRNAERIFNDMVGDMVDLKLQILTLPTMYDPVLGKSQLRLTQKLNESVIWIQTSHIASPLGRLPSQTQ